MGEMMKMLLFLCSAGSHVVSSQRSYECKSSSGDDPRVQLSCLSSSGVDQDQSLTCQPASNPLCPDAENRFCVRFCQDIEDLRLDLTKQNRLLYVTKKLLNSTIESRRCYPGQSTSSSSRQYFCCSTPEPSPDVLDRFGLLVITGYSYDRFLNSSELIDLSDPLSNCRSIPNYPFALDGAVGTMISDSLALVCGGKVDSLTDDISVPDCQYLNVREPNARWKFWKPMKESRSYAAAVNLPHRGFLVTGGDNHDGPNRQRQDLSSTELLSLKGGSEWTAGPDLPQALSRHCAVQLGNQFTMIIGGSSQERAQDQVWIYDWSQGSWMTGPRMISSRMDHACGAVIQISGNYLVAVAGGRNEQATLATSEIMVVSLTSLQSASWTKGPDLKWELFGARMATVETKKGQEALALVGGYAQLHLSSRGIGYSQSVVLLQDDASGWQDVAVGLTEARYQHVVLPMKLLPSDCLL